MFRDVDGETIPVPRNLPVIRVLPGDGGSRIEVFDSMAFFGSGNARAMASGVSKATIPTMAGMVVALSGVFAVTYLNRESSNQATLFEEQLTRE